MLIEDLRERALCLRQSYIWGDIDDDLAFDIVNEISYLSSISKEDIVLLIHSDGGDLDSACSIIDEIQASQRKGIKVWTIAMGIAHSAAAYILSLGSKGYRMSRPNSSIMLHPCSISLESDYESNQVALMTHILHKTETVNKQVAKACGKSKNYKKFLNDIDKGLWLNAKQAVDYGVVDSIWRKTLPIGGFNDDQEKSE